MIADGMLCLQADFVGSEVALGHVADLSMLVVKIGRDDAHVT